MAYIMSRRAALAGLAGSLAVLRAVPARAATKLRVGKAVAENWGNVPLDIGMQFGIFEKHGIEVEELIFAGGAKLAQAVTAGEVDIALSGGPDMAYLAKGAPEIAVGTIADTAAFMGISVGSKSTARSIDDLKGKKIGVTSQGSTTYWLVYQLNRAKGWTGDDAAKPIVIGGSPAAGFAGLKTGDIDADVGGTSTGYQLEERGDGRLLIDCSEYVPPIALYLIFASTALVKQNPEAVRGFLKGWYDSIAFMKSHKAESVPIAAKVMGYTPGVAQRMYDTLMAKFSTDGKFNPQAFETLRETFIDMKTLDPNSVDMSKFYTTEFLPQT
ncbi:MAG TPA: ABC transporter substrate-binding protein [Stellaceae bacterium]|jgi:ABC-type nitrate/sulfonate/bicarbonate transport system substrate-binding protein|nr:ABC transporter substrate-binding protein [Stellaceae bacterium]